MSTDSSNTVGSIEKLNKPELLAYTIKLTEQYNTQNANYSVLYTEYQKLLEANNASNIPVDENIALNLKSELDRCQIQLTNSIQEISRLSSLLTDSDKEIERLKTELDKLFKNYQDSLKTIGTKNTEIEALHAELVNIKLEKTKAPNNLKTINVLEKNTQVQGCIHVYEIKAHENRVDNSEFYQGREFTIAKIIVKLEDRTFSWTVDFIGSELFKPENFSREVVMSDEQYTYFNSLLKQNTLYNAMKYMLDIPTKFDSKIWFDSILCKLGNETKRTF